ncbi:MAG: ATP-binding cassette domain-containing protein, partial [Stellaceae bacterium]
LLSANPAGLRRFPPAALAVRVREALSAGQHAIEEADQLREAGCALAVALIVLAAAAPPLAALCACELCAAAILLHRLWSAVGAATLALGERTPRLEQAFALAARAIPGFRAFGAAGWLLGETGRALAAVLAAGARGERAALRARGAGRIVFLLQPLVIGTASAAGLAGPGLSPLSPWRFAGALLSACAAAAAIVRIGAVTGTRRARQERMAAVIPLLATAPTARDHPAAPIARVETLALDRVWFGYAEARPILRGADLTVRRGEIVALLGSGGSGKTTVLRLLAGLAEPCRGRVLVNGCPLAMLDPGDFRRRIALAAEEDQDFLPATLRAAIVGARPLPLDAATAAARLAGLGPQIAALPMGMHTLIVAGAAPDGLVQRLIIARALAARPELLLLDDVLAALAPDACKHLLGGLRGCGMTVVLTARDPALALLADRVLHLKGGRIIS